MDALIWEAPRTMRMGTMPLPEPAADEVLIAVSYAGICGSELGGYLGHNALRVPPLVMGHEFSGTIERLGSEVEGPLSVGSAVTCNPMIACGECVHCLNGLPNLCLKRSLVGAHRPGAFAQKVVVPARIVHELPPPMALRDGAFVEPVAVAVRIVKLAGPLEARTVLVIGAGPIGLLAVQLLKDSGAGRILCTDIDAERLAMAVSCGAEPVDVSEVDLPTAIAGITDGIGVEVCIDAVGAAQTRAQSVAATRSGGLVVQSGLHEESSLMPVSDVIRREITVKGAFCYDAEDFSTAIEAVVQARVRFDPWLVEAPLDEGGAWFERLLDHPGNVSKVLLVP